ncbi:receptor-like protein EIX1 [Ziziphus jujuba]|uniref:Receptor-like protein EIX1 n=1 Tax=Ziziphus jujuba TaxID=326968 RepID=A0ABM4A190_ZIZJJ|nr:receptor-like protein EIX1 [Ziziphus jujuba]
MGTIAGLPLMLPILCFIIIGEFLPNTDAKLMNCLESDREALIDFKNGLHDPENRLSSWEGSNCCQWWGISCENTTGAVISVDLHNPYPEAEAGLDSSGRYAFWNISGEIRSSLTKLKSLRHLDLSFNTFDDNPITEFFGSLKNLQYLNLSNAGFSGAVPPNLGNLSSLLYFDLKDSRRLHVDNLEWVTGLISLKHLVMNEVDLSMAGSDWIRTLKKLPSLTELHLSSCMLSAPIPPLTFVNLTSLAVLDLSYNSLNSKIPDWLVNISSLVSLDLTLNNFYGRIPLGFSDLPNLQILVLNSNYKLTASCHQLFRGRWEMIRVLNLAGNKLHGKLPASIGNLTFLTDLALGANNDHYKNLSVLWLNGNELNGPLPKSLGQLSELSSLDVSSNQLTGMVTETHFSNLGHLPSLLNLASNAVVDVSSNLFKGSIPLPSDDFYFLNVSKIKLSGTIPYNISGSLIFLSISDNQITGEIPASISNNPSLQVIDLSNNNLIGSIPSVFVNCFYIKALDLSKNNLSGSIPTDLGFLSMLQTLHLNDNNLSGEIPSSFQNLASLETLDLGNNRLTSTIPAWIGKGLEGLRILKLRGNAFSGELPPVLSNLSSKQVLDLAENRFQGSIPASFGDFKAMTRVQNINRHLLYGMFGKIYEENLVVNMKDQSLIFSKIPSLVVNMDLSGNNLSGDLPREITKLSGLVFLNLLRNRISGHIPESISKLKQLSSLDLSSNKLSDHMTTFDAPLFAGNIGLCDIPLDVKCPSDDEDDVDPEKGLNTSKNSRSGDTSTDKWFYLSVGLGFAVGILVPYLVIAMKRSWSVAYFNDVEKVVDRILFLWLKYRTRQQRNQRR